MKLATLSQILHPSVFVAAITHPPRLIQCEICDGTRLQIRTAANAEIGSRCLFCRGTSHHRGVFSVLRNIYGKNLDGLSGRSIYEVSAHGAVFDAFQRITPQLNAQFQCSELLPCKSGEYISGVRCENLERLTFADDAFDLVTSTGLMEHVEHDASAYAEIARVLKPGGYYVFTVPYSGDPITIVRAVREESGIRHVLPPEYHSDPWNHSGVLTWRKYGRDIVDTMRGAGLDGHIRPVQVSGLREPLSVMVAHRD